MRFKSARKPSQTTTIRFVTEESAKKFIDFKGKSGECTVRYSGSTTHILTGVGQTSKLTPATVCHAAAAASRKCMELSRTTVSVLLPSPLSSLEANIDACIDGLLLGNYTFSKYTRKRPALLNTIETCGFSVSPTRLRTRREICASVNFARDLVNDNARHITPTRLASEARAIGKEYGMTVTVLTEKELKKKGMGLLMAVGQGSPFPPRLILLEYSGNNSYKKKRLSAGKGITLDSGGQNLKTSGHIETMRCDMAGAAAVLGIMKAVGALKPRSNVSGIIPAAHNAIDGTAYFPGDVYRSFSGKTVEINNTDAEGRLALADALSWGIRTCKPTECIDLATLTGSILGALGTQIAGLFSNSEDLVRQLFSAGELTGERVWRLPVYPEFSDSLKSDIADLRNTSKLPKGHAGSITAAAFLQEFTEKIPWAHLDIAGTAFNEGETRGATPKYATGWGVRLILEYLLSNS